MSHIDKVLNKLENCLTNQVYEEIETDMLELKNMPSVKNDKSFDEIKKTICAFLNTQGGILIIGVKEKRNPKLYELTGYREDFEENFKRLHGETFKDENQNFVNLSKESLSFQIKDLLDKRVAILHVDKLPEDKKFVYYDGVAYERKITGDHDISKEDIRKHNEYKEEIKSAKELDTVPKASLDHLNIDILNEYIYLLNKEVKITSPKADIISAKEFLYKRFFINEEEIPTILGMLVCGKDLEHFLGSRCQIDCFVDSPLSVAQNKKVLKNNVLPLLEDAFNFVYRNIQVGVNIENSGSSVPEYPENLIRECLNNSLAHRDYSIDKYINVNIKPNKHIEIRNPGSFPRKLLIEQLDHSIPIRRIIPNPKAVNPKLADVLKVYNKWEGKGIGMATLVNQCLDNKIDLPYYRFYDDSELALFVQSDQLLDDEMALHLKMYDRYISDLLDGEDLTHEQKMVLAYLYKSERYNERYYYTILLTPDNNHQDAIIQLEKSGIISKHPESPSLHPVFILDRQLMKTKFNEELRGILGKDAYDNLGNDYKDCLRIIYQYNEFSTTPYVSANQTANTMFFKEHRRVSDVKVYDAFKRKIRLIFNKLENSSFILRKEGKPKYFINKNYQKNRIPFD